MPDITPEDLASLEGFISAFNNPDVTIGTPEPQAQPQPEAQPAPQPEPSSRDFKPADGGNPYWLGGADANGVPFFSPSNPPPLNPPLRASEPDSPGAGFGGNRDFLPFNPDMPYAVPTLRNDAGGRRMENALGMVANLLGVGSGRPEVGTAGGAYRDDWQARNPGRNFDETVVDVPRSGIDTSGMENGGLPVQRTYAITGKELGAEPFNQFSDLRNFSGYNAQQRFGAGLNPTTLENGNQVLYDKFNNLTYGVDKNGNPDRLLAGGRGYQGGASGGAYGLIPTVDRFGRPVFWEGPQGNRTFLRNGDRVGADVANMPARPASTGTGSRVNPPAPEGEKVILQGEGYTYMVNPADNSIRSYAPNGDSKVISYDDFLKAKAAIESRQAGRTAIEAANAGPEETRHIPEQPAPADLSKLPPTNPSNGDMWINNGVTYVFQNGGWQRRI